MAEIALFGLGTMGAGIAHNLLKAGHRLRVWNRTRARAEPVLAAGAEWADSPAGAARDAGFALSIVADDAASRQVWLGKGGALDALPAGAVAVECSTLSVAWVAELNAAAARRGVDLVDAPLGGSKLAAEAGSLTLFVGASPEALERARPVLGAFSKQLIHFGPTGSGAAYKLINNMLVSVHVAALGEALAVAERAGLDLQTVSQAFSIGAVSSPIVKSKIGQLVARDHQEAHFRLRLMFKDVSYGLQHAADHGVDLPVIAAARARFAQAVNLGLGDLDFGAVGELARQA